LNLFHRHPLLAPFLKPIGLFLAAQSPHRQTILLPRLIRLPVSNGLSFWQLKQNLVPSNFSPASFTI